ncbi:hypothetical protein GCM10008915_71820 [Bifidobacterium pullorum subsp. gallinarum]
MLAQLIHRDMYRSHLNCLCKQGNMIDEPCSLVRKLIPQQMCGNTCHSHDENEEPAF